MLSLIYCDAQAFFLPSFYIMDCGSIDVPETPLVIKKYSK